MNREPILTVETAKALTIVLAWWGLDLTVEQLIAFAVAAMFALSLIQRAFVYSRKTVAELRGKP